MRQRLWSDVPGIRRTVAKIEQSALHCILFCVILYYMPRTKISTLNLRVNPAIKRAVRKAAAREHRSVANMIEVLIRRHCEQTGISITESAADATGETEHG